MKISEKTDSYKFPNYGFLSEPFHGGFQMNGFKKVSKCDFFLRERFQEGFQLIDKFKKPFKKIFRNAV